MSFGTLLRHQLVAIRRTASGVDGRRQPVYTTSELSAIAGYVQPRTGREMRAAADQGAVVATHIAYLAASADVQADDVLRLEPDDGRRFAITAIRDAAGRGHHLELDLREVAG